MDPAIREKFDHILSEDHEQQNQAYLFLLQATSSPVDWVYEVWDELVANLGHASNRVRAISSQILCNLAQSDPELRIQKDFPALLNVTRDERFVTARHCLQSLWKVGAAGEAQQRLLVDGLVGRYHECVSEKNCTLIRYDIIQSLRDLYNARQDEAIRAVALDLIAQEQDEKYRKKYAAVWKDRPAM